MATLQSESSSVADSSAVDSEVATSNAPSTDLDADRVSDPHTQSTQSFWEEEVIEDDESIEEEVIDDDDAEYEEEVVEDEVVDDSDVEEPKDSDGDDADSDAPASTGAVPGTEEAPETGSPSESSASSSSESEDDDNLPSGGDVENQQEPVQEYQQQRTLPMVSGTPEKPVPSPKSCWYWILHLTFFGLVGAGAGIGYWLTTMSGDDVSKLGFADDIRPGPPASVSTKFDPVLGGCDFKDVTHPSPIDQCLCSGEITDLEADVVERYRYNVRYFIPDHFEDYNEDISSCSPRNQALVWMSSAVDEQLPKTERTELFTLATIYASLGGSEWNNSTNWLTDGAVCNWYGVSCVDDYVTELVLDGNNLVGTLPFELSLLENLQFLMVARNKLSGPLPVSLFSIQALGTVDVGFNSITGVIPPAVGSAPSLNSLNVEYNAMSGLLTKGIGKASNLGNLNLRANGFFSVLPSELFDLKNLKSLDIGDNEFTGTIPSQIAKLGALETLSLGPNPFTGTIPSTIGSLDKLSYLSVIGIEDLTGQIPAEFGFELVSLETLIISETGVSGSIDTSFGRLPSLKSLDLSKNQLRSAIPSELGNLASLVTLDLGHNFLDGQIPETLGSIATLEEIRLNDNLLQGGIPLSFGNLSSLEVMRLESNRLEDRVTDEVCSLRDESLSVFVVDCPVEIKGDSGTETIGVVCKVPECCTECIV